MVKIIFVIQWLETGTIGAFLRCLLMFIKRIWHQKYCIKIKSCLLKQALFGWRWFYSFYKQSHCTKCVAGSRLQNWLGERTLCTLSLHDSCRLSLPDVPVTSGKTGLSAAAGLAGQTRRLKSPKPQFNNWNSESWQLLLKLSSLLVLFASDRHNRSISWHHCTVWWLTLLVLIDR